MEGIFQFEDISFNGYFNSISNMDINFKFLATSICMGIFVWNFSYEKQFLYNNLYGP